MQPKKTFFKNDVDLLSASRILLGWVEPLYGLSLLWLTILNVL